jgi:SlyX protein
MEMGMEARIIELETRLTFQDDLLQKLDDVVIKQQQEIDELKAQLVVVNEQLNQVLGLIDPPEEGPPPHY